MTNCIRCRNTINPGERVLKLYSGTLCWSCTSNPKPLGNVMKTIRQIVQAQVDRLGVTAYHIAHAAKVDGKFTVSINHVQEYLAGRKDMTSEKLDAVFKVLGLKVTKK